MKEMIDDSTNLEDPIYHQECDAKPMEDPRRKKPNYSTEGYRGGISRRLTMKLLMVEIQANGIPNYGKFLKDLVSNKSKMEQIYATFLTEECSAILQNKIPPKLGDPRSFLIPCKLANSVEYSWAIGRSCARKKLKRYSYNLQLFGTTLKPTRMRIGEDGTTFHIDKAMQHSHANDDTCFRMDVIDDINDDELDDLLNDSKPFLNTSEKISETPLDKEFDEITSENVQ
ncbi:hypothetical protein Tco_0355075 [Tanacetum coccineum]